MDKYLQEILLEMNMIIIPGLGALSMVNRATGEIMFMSYLKHDDHVLAKHIAAKEGWEENDAVNLISKYVREIEAKLNVGESYDMYRFGSFKKDSSGDATFESWIGEATEVQEEEKKVIVPLEVIEIPKILEAAVTTVEQDTKEEVLVEIEELKLDPIVIQEESEELVIEEVKIIIKKEGINESEPVVEVKKIKKPKSAVIPLVIPESVQEVVAEAKTEKTLSYTEEDQWKDDLDLPPVNAKVDRPKKPIIEKAKSDKKKRKPAFYILTVFLVLLIGSSVAVGIFYNQLKQFLPFVAQEVHKELKESPQSEEKKIVEVESDPIVTEESIPEKTEVIIETTPEVNSSESIQTSTGTVDINKPFHLIAGAFGLKENAERFQIKLNTEGNSSVIIGQFDQLYIVSVGSYSSKEEAQQEFQTKKANYPKAWIFQWP